MPYSTFLSLRYLSNIRPTSELLSGYTDAPPARPRGVATLKVNYKGQFHNIDFYIVNHEASVIVGLPTCIKLNLITPGKEMHIADTLSRSYLNKDPPSTVEKEIAEDAVVSINTIITDAPVSNSKIDKIREECARDEEIQLLREYLHNGFPHDSKYTETHYVTDVVIKSTLRRHFAFTVRHVCTVIFPDREHHSSLTSTKLVDTVD